MSALPVILLMWGVTYPVRLLGLSLGRLQLPPFWLAFLRFVPVSVFAALIVPDVLGSPEWPRRLVGCAVGMGLMWRSRNLALGIMGGLAAYWVARLAGL
ncbi:branched-chain amino acid transport [Deinococcus geothermalis DSM 11300]|uniref:Branched-chain amino acid transport n=1 Tax=Deinococcus geothermalis (strain DSM 11300 / CIP 105573 / AG-3a) TaxID=319795 RepID=Q1IWY6_DEIGD|nr:MULTISPECIES: AzlD domain-containing protein [Deinococcus]ABF46248.1 branched-chain amino acid transport [Deinococcus geothermalis DSM 11300]MBI0444711.1 AzlD domain-containing protein [Deinococcus sp. DB0503]